MAVDLGEIKEIAQQGYEAGSAIEEGINGNIAEELLAIGFATEVAVDAGGLMVAIVEVAPIILIAALVGIIFWALYQVINNLPVIGGYLEDRLGSIDRWITDRITSLQYLVNQKIANIGIHLENIVTAAVWYGPLNLRGQLEAWANYAYQQATNYTVQADAAIEGQINTLLGDIQQTDNAVGQLYSYLDSSATTITNLVNAVNTLGLTMAQFEVRISNLESTVNSLVEYDNELSNRVLPAIQADLSNLSTYAQSIEQQALLLSQEIVQAGTSISDVAAEVVPLLRLMPLARLAPQAITTLTEVAKDDCRCLHGDGDYSWLPVVALRAYDLARNH